MKIWLKLLIGSLLGVIAGFLLPFDNHLIIDRISWLAELSIRIGRYSLIPVLVFSLTIAIYELRQDGLFWRIVLKTFVVIIFTSTFVIGVGILAMLIFPPNRIPILIEQHVETIFLNTAENILNIFPSNMFAAVMIDGVNLLPACVFAFFLGMGLSYDRNYTKPVIALIDSLSRIFYHISAFFSEIMGLIMIILGAFWAIRFNSILQMEIFRDLMLLLVIVSVALGFGILPLFLYLIKPKANPWIVLYGSLSQAMAGFFSGDINFTLPIMFRHMKENLGARRRANTVSITLFAIFGRAGSAMVAAISLIVIINSYSSLGISLQDILIIAGNALLISFLLASYPGNGAYIALAALCISYGRGFETGYLILMPIAFFLVAIGTFLDIMICSVATFGISRSSGFQEDKDLRHFI